jgi:FkbM family methyltransferase
MKIFQSFAFFRKLLESGFVYRRLSRIIPCVLFVNRVTRIVLYDKNQVNSFADVFAHPFYWRLRDYLNTKPRLIVDCGSHCGHTSILFDLCVEDRFGSSDCKYILIEANPFLVKASKQNLLMSAIGSRATVLHGLLGELSGVGYLHINPRSLLTGARKPGTDLIAYKVDYLNLNDVVGDQWIDVLKIDIEGSEFDLIRNTPNLFSKVRLLFIEIHGTNQSDIITLEDTLATYGLKEVSPPSYWCGQRLSIYSKDN